MANGQIRYAVVGLGWFAQIAVLPAFEHASRNSRLVALFSGDREKLHTLGKRYGAEQHYGYVDLESRLAKGDIDAVYIVTPNHLHCEHVLAAARAGVHVLCEKPMAVTVGECERMIRAADAAGVKLMIAYRLHFEACNLEAVEIVSSGKLGDLRIFNAVYGNVVDDEDNIRLGPVENGGGPIYDIGIYCLNASRYLFRDEPVEVAMMSARADEDRFSGTDSAIGALLRFPGDRLATFTCSFDSTDRDAYTVLGTRGRLDVEPAFSFHRGLGRKLTIDGETSVRTFDRRDQVAPELLYFSDCILDDRAPEPSGHEGLADVRVIEALLSSARSRELVKLPPLRRSRGPDRSQEHREPAPGRQRTVNVDPPS